MQIKVKNCIIFLCPFIINDICYLLYFCVNNNASFRLNTNVE
ncbi:hypothetical protein NEIELOOT_00770 [Neisseria elongata subsp. glycolytica ATCC 29315]|uniref:Uncharacterized protein n=1 Tax=Neisseria elongata subsp. glycolytica ATCC 29315 TaxID=546263 RepID=D4DNY6_NEIEG|nr:hypothetical protein NEIELOOT_00770 [Neisseria elongata subsp. glycolytica ATCC 29315]